MDLFSLDMLEGARRPAFLEGVHDLRERPGKAVLQKGGRRDDVGLPVEDGDPLEPLPVAEPFHEAVEFLAGLGTDERDDRFPEAFGQEDDAALQVGRETEPLLPYLV